jgi:hypothetical protein
VVVSIVFSRSEHCQGRLCVTLVGLWHVCDLTIRDGLLTLLGVHITLIWSWISQNRIWIQTLKEGEFEYWLVTE